jgi:hypothetical protein
LFKQGGGFQTATPLAGKNRAKSYIQLCHVRAQITRLLAACIIKIPLRSTNRDFKIARVTITGCKRMPHEQNLPKRVLGIFGNCHGRGKALSGASDNKSDHEKNRKKQ